MRTNSGNNNNKRNRPRQRGRTNLNMNLNNMLAVKLNGRVQSINPDPPRFVATPWNQATIALSFTSEDEAARGILSVEGLAADLKAQMGVTTNSLIQMRLDRIRAWSQGDSSPGNFNLFNIDIFDITDPPLTDQTTDRVFTSINDVESKNHFAAFGFTYPTNFRNRVLENGGDTSGAELILGVDYQAGSTVFLYVNLLWRFAPPSSAETLKIQEPKLLSLKYV